MCVLCGNGMGCWAFALTLKKSRLADARVLCAGVNTSSPGGGGAPHAHTITARDRTAVGVAAIPLRIGQVRRMRVLGRHRAVALRVRAVAEAAVLLEERLAGFDRFLARRDRILQFLAFGTAAGILRRHGRERDERDPESQSGPDTTHDESLSHECAVESYYGILTS